LKKPTPIHKGKIPVFLDLCRSTNNPAIYPQKTLKFAAGKLRKQSGGKAHNALKPISVR
jgi:hypothetical protein